MVDFKPLDQKDGYSIPPNDQIALRQEDKFSWPTIFNDSELT